MESGRRNTWLRGAVTYSANPPLVSRPISMPFGQTCAAVELRVDDDPLSRKERVGVARLHDLSDHFMAHDSRIADGNRAIVDFEIRSADAAVRHTNQHVAGNRPGPRHIVQHQLPRC